MPSPTAVLPSPTAESNTKSALTVTPAPTATPTPTLTPEPTMRINLVWPALVSPLEPVPVAVTFDPPPLEADFAISATVLQPNGERYAVFELGPDSNSEGANPAHYVSPELLQLPLIPASGRWWLVVHADTPHPLTGLRVQTFTAETPPFRDLSGVLPDRAAIQVPAAFETVIATGDPKAGGRVWAYAGGELGIWWTPGPAEDLTLTTARMLVGASHATNTRFLSSPEVMAPEAMTWSEKLAYRFEERWGDASSVGRVWVIQDDEDWLYLLRLRPTAEGHIPVLLTAVAETFKFVK